MKRLLREVEEDLAVPGVRKMALEDYMDFGYHGFRQSIGSLPMPTAEIWLLPKRSVTR